MGWARGSLLMSDIVSVVKENIDDTTLRKELYKGFILAFQDMDCDTLRECVDDDEAFHDALYEIDEYYREYVDEDEGD